MKENQECKKSKEGFGATRAFKQEKADAIPSEITSKLVKEFMEAYSDGGVSEYAYVLTHPEVLSLSVDLFFASMCVQAFMKEDRVLNHFMDIRQNFSSRRLGG